MCCDINEELFYPTLGLFYRGIPFIRYKWRIILCGGLVLFVSLGAIIFHL